MTNKLQYMLLGLLFASCASSPRAELATSKMNSNRTDTAPPKKKVAEQWQSRLNVDHVLVGRIWDTDSRSFITRDLLFKKIENKRYILLGERHDNLDHHRLQSVVLEEVVIKGRRPTVVMEMINSALQPTIDQQLKNNPANLKGFVEAVKWNESGWPPWEVYAPLLAKTLMYRLPIIGANLTREQSREIVTQGLDVWEKDIVTRYRLDEPLPKETEDNLIDHLKASHCNMLPESMLERMVLVQRCRDALMAEQMRNANPNNGAILIAGAEHARTDRGVPWYLQTDQSTDASRHVWNGISIAFIEVMEGAEQPLEYAEQFGLKSLPFDIVWFTPRVNDDDHCEELKRHMEHMRSPI